jgi:hypothetical protein
MKVTINKQEFTLKYNNRSLFKIEKELNVPITKLFTDENELSKLHTIYVIVHSGIQEEISFDDFSDLATFSDLETILPKAIEQIGESFDTGVKKK